MGKRKRTQQQEIRHEIVKFYGGGDTHIFMMIFQIEKDIPVSGYNVPIQDSIYYTAIEHFRVPMIMN